MTFRKTVVFLGLIFGVTHACPDVCRCVGDVVNCSNLGLTSIPDGIPPIAVEVLLDHNRITSLASPYSQPGRRLGSLRVLDLSYNELTNIPNSAFADSDILEVLKLDHNNIEFEQDFALDPFGGLEDSLVYLSASHNRIGGTLLQYTYGYHSKMKYLDLSYNNFMAVEAHSLPTIIEHIDLSYNDISVLPARSFASLTNLQYLDLRGLAKQDLSVTLFRDLKALTRLRFGGPNLSDLTQSLLQDLKSLESLEITDSQLSTLPALLLESCGKLTTMNLSSNRLRSFTAPFFSFVPLLRHFNVENNRISNVESLARALAAPNLTTLNLDSNRIASPILNLLTSQPELENLQLAKNRLTSVNESLSSPTLRSLSLAYNSISYVSPDAFTGLTALQSVDLSGNSLDALPDVQTQQKLKLVVGHNSWECNCEFVNSFVGASSQNRDSRVELDCADDETLSCITCATPARLQGVFVGNLTAQNFTACTIVYPLPHSDMGNSVVLAAVVTVIAVLVIAVVIVAWLKRNAIKGLLKKDKDESAAGPAVEVNVYAGIYGSGDNLKDNEYGTVGPAPPPTSTYAVASETKTPYEMAAPPQTDPESSYALAGDLPKPNGVIQNTYVTEAAIGADWTGPPKNEVSPPAENPYQTPRSPPLADHYEPPLNQQDAELPAPGANLYILPEVVPTGLPSPVFDLENHNPYLTPIGPPHQSPYIDLQ